MDNNQTDKGELGADQSFGLISFNKILCRLFIVFKLILSNTETSIHNYYLLDLYCHSHRDYGIDIFMSIYINTLSIIVNSNQTDKGELIACQSFGLIRFDEILYRLFSGQASNGNSGFQT